MERIEDKKTNYIAWLRSAILVFCAVSILACKSDENGVLANISPFAVENDTTLSLNGEINSATYDAFIEAIRQNPNTTHLIFKIAPGSSDDETNLRTGRKLKELQLNTSVMDNGEIASGAVDLFLAGTKRSLGTNTKVGVHSWSDGVKEATEFPRDSQEHQFFIRYYTDIGMTQQLAEDFYFFTIESASADDIHWMTETELLRYNVTN